MKTKKSTLITIIVLLIIFVPLAAYGTITKFAKPKEPENVNHDFYFNGSLYFYDEAGNEVGRYTCNSPNCGNPKTIIDDTEYGFTSYPLGSNTEFAYHDNNYALIEDNGEIFIYSLKLNQKIVTFEAIKNYNTDIEGNLLIAKSNGKWGIINLNSMMTTIPYQYDFIGISKFTDNTKVEDLIIKEADSWYILGIDGTKKSTEITETIKNYNDRYLITNENKIYDYSGSSVALPLAATDIYGVDQYIILINNNLVFVYEDLTQASLGFAQVNTYEKIAFDLSDNVLNIYLDGTMGASIDLN